MVHKKNKQILMSSNRNTAGNLTDRLIAAHLCVINLCFLSRMFSRCVLGRQFSKKYFGLRQFLRYFSTKRKILKIDGNGKLLKPEDLETCIFCI